MFEDIKKKSLRFWQKKGLFQSTLDKENIFPLIIPFKKVSSKSLSTNLLSVRKEVQTLLVHSKKQKGKGYIVEMEEVNTRNMGKQSLPQKVYFETLEDFLFFVDKEQEWKAFMQNFERIKQLCPSLESWCYNAPHEIIKQHNYWGDLLKVCRYFLDEHQPNQYYIRELPIDIDTKFIEKHSGILKKLLDYILPENKINTDSNQFAIRYYCLYNEPLVRVRLLDKQLVDEFSAFSISDISLPLSDFARLKLSCERVIIVENKASHSNIDNFLTLPLQSKSIAIFGQGFGAGLLKNVEWLKKKEIMYWGDIDQAGFEILNMMRSYFPQLRSFCMDKATFKQHSNLVGNATHLQDKNLTNLTEGEQEVYQLLCSVKGKNNRLEQEKIRQEWVLEKIKAFI